MPLIQRKGAQSSQGFGEFSAAVGGGDGTKGIFALGYNTPSALTTRNKYTYSSCTSTACGVGAASAGSNSGSAAGNSTRGIFALGGGLTTRNKYTYASCTSTASGVAASSAGSTGGAAAGNLTRGIFSLGMNSVGCYTTTRNKYTYACCTSTASGVAVASQRGGCLSVAGNASIGNNLTIGANATIGNNLSLGGNIRIGNNANIGNSVTIGNLLTIGNNATIGGNVSIGANLFVTGLINTGSLISNTVNTTTMLNGAVSGGIGNTSTTTINFVPPVFGTVYNANISSTITTIQANQDVYLWSQVPYFLSLGGYTSGNTWGSNVTVYLSRTTSNVSTTVFSQSYTTEQSVNQTSITGQAVFCGFIDTPATPATYTYSMLISVSRASGSWTPGQLSLFSRTFLIQTLKR